MFSKKKEIFLLIFLIFLQSCSGGRIGNFLESSFDDLEKISQEENLQKNLEKPKSILENQDIYDKSIENKKKVEKSKSIPENKKEVEKRKSLLENKKDINSEKVQKQKNNKIKNYSKKRKIQLQSYKIIFILKDVDPKDPIEKLSTVLGNSELNFEIEKIERILDSKIKDMNKN